MTRRTLLLGICLTAVIAAAMSVVPLLQAPPAGTNPLDALAPAGALLVLESPDFATLVRDWDGSQEKQLWLASANYQEFSRSRLYLRLQEAQQEFAAAGSVPPDMNLVRSVAGSESLLALYDIGKLELLYITRMPAARAAESVLWQARSKFEPRNAAGAAYYVAFDKGSGKTVAFATAGDLLVLGTREDLVAGALQLLAGRSNSGASLAAVSGERWYTESVKAAGKPGDLRMVMNLEALVRTPYFRSYWIQRNAPEVRTYYAGLSDLYRQPDQMREERVLLRAAGQEAPAARPGVDALLGLAPENASLYRAWSAPSPQEALNLLSLKILSPHAEGNVPRTNAPRVALTGGETGTEGDLETMIDEAPPQNARAVFVPGPMLGLIQAAKPQGMLQLESTKRLPAGVFVRTSSVIVLLGDSDWNAQAARDALAAAVEGLWSRSGLGVKWAEKKRGARSWYALDGLAPLAMAVDGRWLLVANDPDLLGSVLDRLKPAGAAAPGKVFAAGFRHAAERANFGAMMSALDHVAGPAAAEAAPGDPQAVQERPPRFFSDNIASLSKTLARVESSSIEMRENGNALNEIVIYRLSK